MHKSFPILTFHYQNFTRYHEHLVRHHHFITTFDCPAAEPKQATNLIAIKRKFWKLTIGKTLYFRNIVRNNDVTPFVKSEKKQHASELWSKQALYGRFGLFKRLRRECIPRGTIHAKETSSSTKRRVVKDN